MKTLMKERSMPYNGINYYNGRGKIVVRLCISIGNKMIMFQASDIIYCKSEGNYTRVYLKSGECYVSSKHLKELEYVFQDSNLIRVHHSYLVNMNLIKSFRNEDNLLLTMTNGDMITVSRRKKNDFLGSFTRI